MIERLKPCPWCGEIPKIQLMDDEGNFRCESYLDDPWSGISYGIVHALGEKDCPIATDDKNETIGCFLYDTEDEAIDAWNKRK